MQIHCTLDVQKYDRFDADPVFTVGGHQVSIQLVNIPKTDDSLIEAFRKQIAELEVALDYAKSDSRYWKERCDTLFGGVSREVLADTLRALRELPKYKGNLITQIRLVRNLCPGLTLKEAKDFVDSVE